ncbi:MAG: hypothetical protein ACI9JM_001265 [Halioglobus sp.]|jgi:hypothetical protein
MALDKVSFYSRDPGAGSSENGNTGKKPYMGEERRRENRRKAQDQRKEVRFDLNNSDRRVIEGRRVDDSTPKFW